MKKSLTTIALLASFSASAADYQIPFTDIVVSIGSQQGQSTRPAQPNVPAHVQRLAECYARLLGVSMPRIKMTDHINANFNGIVEGKATPNRITLTHNPEAATIAHEMRHIWQFENNKYTGFANRFKPYSQRPAEIDAFAWERENTHRCTGSSQSAPRSTQRATPVQATKAVNRVSNKSGWAISAGTKIYCSAGHKVVKGDTWYNIAQRYNINRRWVTLRASQPLKLGLVACIGGEK